MYNVSNKLGFIDSYEIRKIELTSLKIKIKYLYNDEESRYIFLYKGGKAID